MIKHNICIPFTNNVNTLHLHGRKIDLQSKDFYLFVTSTGEAIADGSALKTDYFQKHEGLDKDEIAAMSLPQLEEHEEKMKEKNAWAIAEDVRNRVDDEPGPGGSFMNAFLTEKKGNPYGIYC